MGKGGGCVPSKKQRPTAENPSTTPQSAPPPADEKGPATSASADAVDSSSSSSSSSSSAAAAEVVPAVALAPAAQAKVNVFVVFYSMYGHVEGLAKRMKKGVDSVDGVEGVLYRVPETLPPQVLELMHAPPKDSEVPEITAAELVQADGLLFGFPTRFGAMAAQMKHFFDSTGQLWREQKLAGKPAGFFVSTGTQGGGMETTAWTSVTQLAHHGMLFVPIGYTLGAGMFKMDEIKGGSPYGAGVYAGDGTRAPADTELDLAEHQGKYMATIVKKMALS